MGLLYLFYFVHQPLHVSGIFVAHHQEVYYIYIYRYIYIYIYIYIYTHNKQFHPNLANQQSTKKHNMYQLLYLYSIPPDDGLKICPKHVEVDWRNKLRINSASGWFILHKFI